MDQVILQQLAACHLTSDQPPLWQSKRTALYQHALDQLLTAALAYPCACSRAELAAALQRSGRQHERHAELIYPGTCRGGLGGRPARAWRLRTDGRAVIEWSDRCLGVQSQQVQNEVGDFILKRADGCFAYQLAVVVDDAAQGITDVVRGADLADNTARQILLQGALALPSPRYLHTPLLLDQDGEKLSKQSGAQPLDTRDPLAALNAAARVLGLSVCDGSAAAALASWVQQWTALYNRAP